LIAIMYKEYGGSFHTRERTFSCQEFDKNLNNECYRIYESLVTESFWI